VDNLFVIAVFFANFKIPAKNLHQLFFLGTIIFRAILIKFGLLLIHKIHSITILFGLFLLKIAFKML
jgi:tellurite resistance protein TerC